VQKWFRERASMLRYTYIDSLVFYYLQKQKDMKKLCKKLNSAWSKDVHGINDVAMPTMETDLQKYKPSYQRCPS
jgi:hypothetical protein